MPYSDKHYLPRDSYEAGVVVGTRFVWKLAAEHGRILVSVPKQTGSKLQHDALTNITGVAASQIMGNPSHPALEIRSLPVLRQ